MDLHYSTSGPDPCRLASRAMTEPPQPPRDRPVVEDVEPGRYAWCACGRSERYPHCDGSHKGTGQHPVIVEIEEARRVAWCACGRSGTPPWCDGSHKAG